jgi:DNA-binding winged helix-turn-helix (wHTH) protein
VKVRLGECEVDLGRRELSRGGRPVHLTPKAFQLLELLVQKRPDAVSKDEIRERIWPGAFVSGVNLATLVFELRKALGDDTRQPRAVRTVRGYGYALCAEEAPPVVGEKSAPASFCRLVGLRREIELTDGENVLGRTPLAVVRIPSTKVSRRHALILVSGGTATVEDLGSKNGTYLGGRKVEGPQPLADGDVIRVGDVKFVFHVVSGEVTDSDPLARIPGGGHNPDRLKKTT